MNERKHTPGPWRISDFEPSSGGENRVVMGADNFSVAWIMGRTVEEHDADARLIAATPDLLDIVERLAAFDGRNSILHLREMARAALAKARGEP